MTSAARRPKRQVSLEAREATSIAVMLDTIENWLRRAPDDVVAPSPPPPTASRHPAPFGWARELISDLRYYSTAMAFAIRATDNPQDDNDNGS